MPCSNHSRATKGSATTNSIAHLEGRRGKLHLLLDGQVGGDHNKKCVHEAKLHIYQ
jgi:hypothetical protein